MRNGGTTQRESGEISEAVQPGQHAPVVIADEDDHEFLQLRRQETIVTIPVVRVRRISSLEGILPWQEIEGVESSWEGSDTPT